MVKDVLRQRSMNLLNIYPEKGKSQTIKQCYKYFQIDGHKEGTEARQQMLDVITSSIKTRFDQPSFGAFLKLESFILQSIFFFFYTNEQIYMNTKRTKIKNNK